MPTVNREAFLQKLQMVQPGLSPREVVEQSSCFIFKNGRVITYNDEIACKIVSGLPKDLTGAVQATPLLAILQKLTEEEIDVEPDGTELVIVGKRRKAGVRMEADILLPVSNIEPPTDWQDLHPNFCEAVGIVQECASKDQSTFAAVCVHVHPKWVEATDNTQLARYRLKTGATEPYLVRRDSIKHITSLGMTQFAETESWIHYRNAEKLVLSSRRHLESFPDCTAVIKAEEKRAPLTLPKGLAEACEKADIFTRDNVEENEVTVELRPGKLHISGQGASGWYSETRKIKYEGRPMSFLIGPNLLKEITQKHNECTVSKTQLRVENERFVFIAALFAQSEKSAEAETEAEPEGGEGDS